MKDITLAQAITIVALLAFAVGWYLAVDYSVDVAGPDDENALTGGAATLMAALWFGPPIWALWAVTDIVRGDDR